MSEQKSFDYWDYFLRECERADAPLYTAVIRGVGQDGALKEIASHVKPGQPMANVLLAAVHFLLLRGAEHPLRRLYPNLNGGRRVADADAFATFKDFVDKHCDEVAALIARGVTNTNEVARCSSLHAGFRAVAKDAGEPLALVELGPSAGLNMIWDRYRVRYSGGGQGFELGPADAELTIACELRGDKSPPSGPTPAVASRVGLELNPVDLSDPYWRDWLKALIWPDQVERFTRLETAIAIAGREKQDIRAGDALDLLPDALAEVPESLPVCVYHTYVVYQFSKAMREALDNILIAASLRRPIWRLSAEGTQIAGDAHLKLRHYRDGVGNERPLALCHPHGAWIEWQD
jgi:hypothetical protein